MGVTQEIFHLKSSSDRTYGVVTEVTVKRVLSQAITRSELVVYVYGGVRLVAAELVVSLLESEVTNCVYTQGLMSSRKYATCPSQYDVKTPAGCADDGSP